MHSKAVLAGAALAALMSVGVAHAQSGHVGLSYQNNDIGGGDIESTAVSGAVLLGSNVQLNGRYASLEEGGGDADYLGFDAFLFGRSASSAFGGYVGFDTVDIGGGDADEWSVGGVGELYTGNTNWTAQLGYGDTEGEIRVIHIDGQARHFLSPNFSIQGNIGYGDVEFDAGGSDDYWSGGIGGEFQFTGAPISIHAGWEHYDFAGGEADAVGIGARWNFGGGTLLDRSRSGASFQRATPTFIDLTLGGVTPR